ncbi:hypothetical protein [Enterococcus mundtii]|uniref:Uncharacterized protein n=1 Tax=Enterococcus mundtii TaxID=53346 RepID=A0ABQ0V9G1_ENTMU|nr:hypothetical protein [Enterococcus mundtii]PTO39113.1 hypothetical protein C6P50_11770 [Enterococcus mundtii]GEL79133.1 hypothetical protein EMU01_02770 [Enterococcus mundtii]GEN17673.1 hypothetical protein LAC02_09540 [Ligilactobacillus acidipiscis]
MTFSDKEYQEFSDKVYRLDQNDDKKYDSDMTEGTIFKIDKKYKILKIQENFGSDGMQAMAVAPLDEKGNVDTSRVVICYAGTNI